MPQSLSTGVTLLAFPVPITNKTNSWVPVEVFAAEFHCTYADNSSSFSFGFDSGCFMSGQCYDAGSTSSSSGSALSIFTKNFGFSGQVHVQDQ